MHVKTLPLRGDEREMFVGRTEELANVRDLLESGLNCAISGQPGIGKTSFLNVLEADLSTTYAIIRLSIPTTDPETFYKKLLFALTVQYVDIIDHTIREKLLYTQEIMTLARGLLYGETLGEKEERKIINFMREFIKSPEEQQIRVYTLEELRAACASILSSLEKKLIIIVDDTDKVFARSVLEPCDQVERLYLFFTELTDVIHTPKTAWLFSLHGEMFEQLEKYVLMQNDSILLSFINDIIPLKPFTPEESKHICNNRIGADVFSLFTESAFRLMLAVSKGNPRLLLYTAAKAVKHAGNEKVTIDSLLTALRANLPMDIRDLMILKCAAEKPFITAGDPELRETVGLDTISISQRLSELTNKRLLINDYDDSQKVYRLVYVHDAFTEIN